MSDSSPRSFSSDFRQFFLRGLVVLLPTVLTLWIVVKAYQFIDNTIAEPINQGIRLSMAKATPHLKVLAEFEPSDDEVNAERRRVRESGRKEPDEATARAALRTQKIQEWWDSWALGSMDLIGIFVAIVAVYFTGRLLGGFFGRRIYRRLEGAITSLPVFKQVYPYVKQVVDFLFGEERQFEFKRVVAVEYPRRGIWSVGLLTGSALTAVSEQAGDESVTIFIPSSPTPFTGYTITVPRREVRDLPMTIDEALRFVVSAGVLMPPHQSLPPQLKGKVLKQPPTPGADSAPPSNGPTTSEDDAEAD